MAEGVIRGKRSLAWIIRIPRSKTSFGVDLAGWNRVGKLRVKARCMMEANGMHVQVVDVEDNRILIFGLWQQDELAVCSREFINENGDFALRYPLRRLSWPSATCSGRRSRLSA